MTWYVNTTTRSPLRTVAYDLLETLIHERNILGICTTSTIVKFISTPRSPEEDIIGHFQTLAPLAQTPAIIRHADPACQHPLAVLHPSFRHIQGRSSRPCSSFPNRGCPSGPSGPGQKHAQFDFSFQGVDPTSDHPSDYVSANTQYISFAAGSKFSIWAAAQGGRVVLICDANIEEIGIL
jgi:hypothetical protein